jgi:hypothetical protein
VGIQVCRSKKDWLQLMDLASGCIDREVIKFGRLQYELLEGRKKCFQSKSCTPPETNAFDFNIVVLKLNCCFSDDD